MINRRTFTLIFIIMILGFYTNIPLHVGITIVGAFAIIPGLLFFYLMRAEAMAVRREILILLTCAVVPTVVNTFNGVTFQEAIQAYIGICVSMLAGLGLFLAVRQQDKQYICNLLLGMAVLLSIILTLEVYTPFRFVSDTVRKLIYNGGFVYQADSRDLSLYGHIRPKGFAQEPSGPARFMAYILFSVIALSTKRNKTLVAIALLVLSTFLISSPSIYASVMLIVMTYVVRYTIINKYDLFIVNATIFVFAAGIAVVATDADVLIATLGGARGEQISRGADASTAMRMLVPPQILFASVKEYGVLGTGMGSRENLQELVQPIFERYRANRGMHDFDGNWLWTNAFFDVFIFMGPFLGLVFLMMLPRIFKIPISNSLLIIFEAVFMLDSGLPAPRNWAYFGLVTACASISFQDALSRRLAALQSRRDLKKKVLDSRKSYYDPAIKRD